MNKKILAIIVILIWSAWARYFYPSKIDPIKIDFYWMENIDRNEQTRQIPGYKIQNLPEYIKSAQIWKTYVIKNLMFTLINQPNSKISVKEEWKNIPDNKIFFVWIMVSKDRWQSRSQLFKIPTEYNSGKLIRNNPLMIRKNWKEIILDIWDENWIWQRYTYDLQNQTRTKTECIEYSDSDLPTLNNWTYLPYKIQAIQQCK